MRRLTFVSLFLILILLTGSLSTLSKAADVTKAQPPFQLALANFIPPSMTTLSIQGNFAYVGAGPYLLVIDVSDPDHPQRVAYLPLPAVASKIASSGGRLYVLTEKSIGPYYPAFLITSRSVMVFDISQLRTPRLIGEYFTQDQIMSKQSMAVDGSILYLGSDEGLSILDFSNPQQPLLLSSIPNSSAGVISAVTVNHTKVILGFSPEIMTPGPSMLLILDVSDPKLPVQIGELSTHLPPNISDLYLSNHLLAVAGSNPMASLYGPVSGFELVDLTDPVHPAILNTSGDTTTDPFGGDNPSIIILDQQVFAAERNLPTNVFDISNPAAPSLIQNACGGPVWEYAVKGDRVYTAAGSAGFAIYDWQAQN